MYSDRVFVGLLFGVEYMSLDLVEYYFDFWVDVLDIEVGEVEVEIEVCEV